MAAEVEDKVTGCILGQAIGDALGTRYEFKSSAHARDQIQRDINSGRQIQGKNLIARWWLFLQNKYNRGEDGHLPLLGGGHLRVAAGQVTDDTEMALALGRSMVRVGTYDSADVCSSYIDWRNRGGFGVGDTTRSALDTNVRNVKSAKQRLSLVCKNSRERNQESLSNGCLMRISPLAIGGYHWPRDLLLDAARANCRLTNPNPIAQDAVAAHVGAIYAALHSADATAVFDTAFDLAKTDTVRVHLNAAKDGPEPTLLADGMLVNTYSPTMGYLGIALQNAFYELLHMDSFEKSLVDVIKRGGDTDTNGCITGALLGAVVGASGIPADWKEVVLTADVAERVKVNPDARLSDLCELAVKLTYTSKPKPANLELPV